MIKNYFRHDLSMDFSQIETPYRQPSDIDLFYIGKTYAIFGEIKNQSGEFTEKQRNLYEGLANSMPYKDVLVLYITHDKRVEDGYKIVDVSSCYVEEYYYKPKWEKGKKYKPSWDKFDINMTVNEVFKRFIGKREKVKNETSKVSI